MVKRLSEAHEWIFSLPVIRRFKRIIRYVIIGSIAALVQLAVFSLLILMIEYLVPTASPLNAGLSIPWFGQLKAYELLALVIAIEFAIITNFNGQRLYTFRDRKDNDSVFNQFAKFQATAISTIIGQAILYTIFRTKVFTQPEIAFKILSQLLAIVLMFIVNFTINYFFIFPKRNRNTA